MRFYCFGAKTLLELCYSPYHLNWLLKTNVAFFSFWLINWLPYCPAFIATVQAYAHLQSPSCTYMCIHILERELETEGIGMKVQVWGSGKWLLVSLYKKRESNGGGGNAHAAEVDNGNTSVYSGSRTVLPRHGHWGRVETFPPTLRQPGKLSVLDILKKKKKEMVNWRSRREDGKVCQTKQKASHVMTLTVYPWSHFTIPWKLTILTHFGKINHFSIRRLSFSLPPTPNPMIAATAPPLP